MDRATRSRRRLLSTAATSLLLLNACVRAYDATIANPCDSVLSLESYRAPSEELVRDQRVARFRLPAEEVTTVERVFDEAAGTHWTLLVVDTEFTIEVTKEQVEQEETILIPASACP